MNEYNTLLMSALLHDIGKFWWRAGNNTKHQVLSEEFVKEMQFPASINKELLSTLILKHHDSRDTPYDLRVSTIENKHTRQLARIVSESDNLSSAMDREKEDIGIATRPLIPIFPSVDIEKGDTLEENYYYKPQALSLDIPFPIKGDYKSKEIKDLHSSLWNKFNNEFKNLPTSNFTQFFETLYFLLEKYTTTVSSAGYFSKPDISLFDHLKTTTAIASCLYKYHSIMDCNEKSIGDRSAPKFLLIGGDISGIQDFIYNVKSPQQAQKGMSKRLRGRSFYISLLTETFAHYTLTELKLPITNLLWCSGGHFFILAPNLEKTIKKLSKIKSAINKYLLKEFQGELYLAIGIADASGEYLEKNFSDILNEVNYELSKVKNEKYFELFNQSEVDVFGPYALKKEVCNICGKDIDAKECTVCELHEDIGKKIPKTNYLVEIRTTGYAKEVDDLSDVEFTYFNLYWKLLEKSEIKSIINILEKINKEKQKIVCIRVYKLNKTDILVDNELINLVKNSNLPITFGFKLIGNTAPIYEDKVLSFDEIAQFGEGINLLGILRMDVDDLGAIFSIGIPKGSRSISRISTLSKKLDLFFLGYLNRITEKYKLHTILCNDCKNKIKEQNYKLRKLKIEMEIDEEETKNKLQFYEVKNPDGKYNSSRLCNNCKKSAMSKLYITYSGGDDVFIVGAYDDIVEVAYDIQEQFREYTCKNPNIGISAGIFMSKEKFPIGRSARYAGNELDNKAKKHENKNAISVFGECVYWEDFKNSKSIGDRLIEEVRNKKLSRSMVHYLLALHNQYNTSDPDYNLMYLPKLIYVVRRNIKDNDLCSKYFIENLARDLDSKIKIIVSWISLKTRKDKK